VGRRCRSGSHRWDWLPIIPGLWDEEEDEEEVYGGKDHGDPFVPAPAQTLDDEAAD